MGLLSATAAGGAIGITHALEPDHLAAVATLVEGDDDTRWAPALVGAVWGVGHSLPIVVLGLAVVALGVRLPASVTVAIEGLVALVLIGLGVRMGLSAVGVRVIRHHHDGRGSHRHLQFGRIALSQDHLHIHGSAVVGVLHGFAGSGGLVVALVAASPSAPAAVGFLAAFAVLTVLTMSCASLLWGQTLGTGLETPLRATAGVASVAVGFALLAEVLSASGLA